MVDVAQAGDKCDFTGTLIVVPDVAQLRIGSESGRGGGGGGEVVCVR